MTSQNRFEMGEITGYRNPLAFGPFWVQYMLSVICRVGLKMELLKA